MIGEKIPLFGSGTILTKEMLEGIKEYAMAEGKYAYLGYADGVYSGCKITTTESEITVNPGIIIFKEQAYYIDKPMTVRYMPTNEWMVFKISFLGEEKSDTCILKEIRASLAGENETGSNDIELCRFKLQNGARLRYDYRNFKDLITEYDTIYEISAKWAAYGNASLSPVVLEAFYKEAVKLEGREAVDMMFLHQIAELKGNTLNRNTILLYLSEKLGWEYKNYENGRIYEGLSEALNRMKHGRNTGAVRERRERRIIVD